MLLFKKQRYSSPMRMQRYAVWLAGQLLVLTMVSSLALAAGPLITCESGTFTLGQPASVTCHFHTDIAGTARDISMSRYSSENDRGQEILLCSWSSEEKKYECSTEVANYTFDGVLTDRLTVSIPVVMREQAAWYKCYFMPDGGIQSHLCQLRTQEKQDSTTLVAGQTISNKDQNDESQSLLPIILPCVLVTVAAVCCVGLLIFRRRRRDRRKSNGQGDPEHLSANPLIQHTNKEEDLLEGFKLSDAALREVMGLLDQEMSKGLNEDTRAEADVKMFPTFVSPLADLPKIKPCLVVDINNTGSKVSLLLPGVRPNKHLSRTIPKSDAVQQQLNHVADQINALMPIPEMPRRKPPVALIVPSPSEHNGSQEAHTLLQQALRSRARTRELRVVSTVNDTVSTLMSVADSDTRRNCRIAFIMDTRLKACYLEDSENGAKNGAGEELSHERIINTELGVLGENGCLKLYRTEFDRELDEHSTNPGSQILEKMVSWTYMGELVTLVLEKMTKEGLLFQSARLGCELFQNGRFSADFVMQIEKDTDESDENTKDVLRRFGVKIHTDDDRQTVQKVCRAVCQRAACLSVACLATIINRVGQPDGAVHVVVDGKLYWAHPRFHDVMYHKTQDLVHPGVSFSLVSSRYGRSFGAARLATAASGGR